MNFKQLEVFVRVAELGSFSKASVVLGIAQPALSRHVRALETDLRETLLLRDGRGVRLTEPGRRLFDHSVGILQQVSRAREEMAAGRDEPRGRVVVGLPPSVGLRLALPLVDRFRHDLPKAKLAVVEGLSAHIAEWITSGRVDVGLVFNPQTQPVIEVTPLLEEPLCLVSPRRRGRAPDGALPLAELGQYPLVVPERDHVIRKLLESQAALAGLKLDVAWEVSSVPAILDLVRAGYGHAVLTASAVRASARGAGLVARPLAQPRLASVLCLALPSHKKSTALARNTAHLLADLVRGQRDAQTE